MLWLNWYSVWLFIWLVISITVNPGMNWKERKSVYMLTETWDKTWDVLPKASEWKCMLSTRSWPMNKSRLRGLLRCILPKKCMRCVIMYLCISRLPRRQRNRSIMNCWIACRKELYWSTLPVRKWSMKKNWWNWWPIVPISNIFPISLRTMPLNMPSSKAVISLLRRKWVLRLKKRM